MKPEFFHESGLTRDPRLKFEKYVFCKRLRDKLV